MEAIYGLREVSRLGLFSYYGYLNCAPYSSLFCSVFFWCFVLGFFLNICVVFWIPRTLPLMLVLLYLVVKTWFLHMLHCLLSNIVFVSEFSIITISLAITHYVLALTLIRRLHRVLLKENKRYKNAVLPLHLLSGTMRW